MNPKKIHTSETVQNPAVAARIDRQRQVDTTTVAWAAFDRWMTSELQSLEVKFHQYFTQRAARQSLGR